MIIDTSQGNVETIGDIKEFKTSIDPKNLEFITTLLSSNLYSNPEQSFIREIVSNAWDSHVEAGTKDVPVIVRIKESDNSITIRDYGTGLSPERFQNIYCNIGSSTKRESNEYIGGFGIGKYSALACSNTVYITSYYEGVAYYYIMVKSGNSITTNLVMETSTEERNGMEVTIKKIPYLSPYYKALECITFFPNVYVDSKYDEHNSTKIKKFNNFVATSRPTSHKLLLGNVLYPFDFHHFKSPTIGFINKLLDTGIVIKFNVGEVEITPNRENIIYSSQTIKLIEERIEAARIELYDIIRNKVAGDYDDILEYCNVMSKLIQYDPITEDINSPVGISLKCDELGADITYRGLDLKNDVGFITHVAIAKLPNYRGAVIDNIISSQFNSYSVQKRGFINSDKLVMLNEGARLTHQAKAYLREKFNGYGILNYFSKDDFAEHIRGMGPSCKALDIIIEGLYDSVMDRTTILDLTNDKDFLEYKDSLSKTKKAKDSQEHTLHVYNPKYGRFSKVIRVGFDSVVEYIKGLKTGVVLTNIKSPIDILCEISQIKGYTCIKAKQDVVKKLRNLNLTCLVDIEWLIHKDPILSVIKAIGLNLPPDLSSSTLKEMIKTVDNNLRSEFTRVLDIKSKYEYSCYKSLALHEDIPEDPYTRNICKKMIEYFHKYNDLTKVVGYMPMVADEVIAALLVRTKAYRINMECYKKFKESTLLSILCKR